MARAYRLGKRAITAAETRQRIIDAARDVISESGVGAANLGLVAQRAGVTRTTVYQQFGSRDEVMLAVLHDALDRADVRTLHKALQIPDAARAARQVIKASTRVWAGEHALFSRVKGLAGLDDAAARVNESGERARRGHIANLAARLADQNKLRPGVTKERAVQVIQLLSSFETFDHLHRIGGMRTDAVATLLTEMIDAAVLVPDAS